MKNHFTIATTNIYESSLICKISMFSKFFYKLINTLFGNFAI